MSSPGIGEIVAEARSNKNMDHDEAIAELFGRWKSSLAAGTPTTPEELCAETPELLSEFKEALPRLAAINALFGGDEETAESAAIDFSVDGNGFRSLSFHRRGGLGVVLVGEDTELQRTVALKRIRHSAATNQEARERFIREAETTARLEHPGIVPVYRLARDSHGQLFYAMRFIQGSSLEEVVVQFRSTPASDSDRAVQFQRLVRALVAVCDTMAYAHARGVIHRDLKPANIMLGPFGETLVVDWGLAKWLKHPEQPPIATSDDFVRNRSSLATVNGKAKGTPAFMSPEQSAGDWKNVGPLSDVYSLGATLYFVLTGRVPISGGDHKEPQTPPPVACDPQVPRPLDAVCRKAMNRNPADRYPDVRSFAEDLERWLVDKPVRAWREPFTVRTRRWLKGHWTLVLVSTATLLVAAAGGLALAVQERLKNHQLRLAYEELAAAKAEVDSNYQQARAAARGLAAQASGLRGLRQERIVTSGVGDPQTVAGLEEARDAFRQLHQANPEDIDNQLDLAAISQLLGLALDSRGEAAAALAAFAESRQSYLKLMDAGIERRDVHRGIALVEFAEARLHLMAARPELAETCLQRGLQALDRLSGDFERDLELRLLQAAFWSGLGNAALMRQQPFEAQAWLKQAVHAVADLEIRDANLLRDRDDRQRAEFALGTAHSNWGEQQLAAGKLPAALEEFAAAHSLLDPLDRARTDLPGFREAYERLLRVYAPAVLARVKLMYSDSASPSDLLSYVESALATWEPLADAHAETSQVSELTSALRVALAETTLQRTAELDPGNPEELREVRRLLQLAMTALDKLPESLFENQLSQKMRLQQIRDSLRVRRAQLPE